MKTFDNNDLELLVSKNDLGTNYQGDILMLHGIFANKHESGRFDKYSELLNKNGYVTYRYDHRGHGNNPIDSSKMSIVDTVIDFVNIVSHINRENSNNLNLIASSYGAGIYLLALQNSKRLPLKKVLLLNPVVDFQSTFVNPLGEQLKEVFSKTNVLELENGNYIIGPNNTKITPSFFKELQLLYPYLSIPMLDNFTTVIHGSKDTAVSFDVCKSRIETNTSVDFIEIENANHAFREPESELQIFNTLSKIFPNG